MNYEIIISRIVTLTVFIAAGAASAAPSSVAKDQCQKASDCDDHNPCHVFGCGSCAGASCSPKRYCQVFLKDIRDSSVCTVDACDPKTGITHTQISCPPSDECHVAGVCKPAPYYGAYPQCTTPSAPNGTPCKGTNTGCGVANTCQNGVCTTGSVQSVGIQFETRQFVAATVPTNTTQAISIWNTLPTNVTGYGTAHPSDLAGFANRLTIPGGLDHQLAYHIKVGINVKANQAGNWGFRVGPDWAYGGAILVDGIELASKWFSPPGIYWNGTFTDPTQSLSLVKNLTQGLHIFEMYGFEDCCDGSSTVQFTAPGISSRWMPISLTAIDTCP